MQAGLQSLSLFQIQSQLSSDNAAEVNAENQLQLAKVALMQIMVMPVSDNFEVDRSGLTEPSAETMLSPDEIYKKSEGIMPEIKSATLKSSASEVGVKLAQSQDLPRLTMGGTLKSVYSNSPLVGYQIETIGFDEVNHDPVSALEPVSENRSNPLFTQFKNNFGEILSVGLTVPIFNNFQGKYGIERAKISYQYTRLNEDAAKLQLRQNIEQAYTESECCYQKLCGSPGSIEI